jgi:hypothetical protein
MKETGPYKMIVRRSQAQYRLASIALPREKASSSRYEGGTIFCGGVCHVPALNTGCRFKRRSSAFNGFGVTRSGIARDPPRLCGSRAIIWACAISRPLCSGCFTNAIYLTSEIHK